jgi:hypothetical protein
MVADLASLPRHALAESVIYTRRSFGNNKARESGVEAIFFLNIVELLSPSDSRFILMSNCIIRSRALRYVHSAEGFQHVPPLRKQTEFS